MRDSQVKGYLLEIEIAKYLKMNGYYIISSTDSIVTNNINLSKQGNGLNVLGRGGWAQVDALGELKIATPFMNPIRLLVEAKYYKGAVGVDVIRKSVGILEDINTNYSPATLIEYKKGNASGGEYNIGHYIREFGAKYDYKYAICSANGFTKDAENFALAHGIYLIDLNYDRYGSVKMSVDDQVDTFKQFASEFRSSKRSGSITSAYVDHIKGGSEEGFTQNPREGMYFTNSVSGVMGQIYAMDNEKFVNSFRESRHQTVNMSVRSPENERMRDELTIEGNGWEAMYSIPLGMQDFATEKFLFIAYFDGKNPDLCTIEIEEFCDRRKFGRSEMNSKVILQ